MIESDSVIKDILKEHKGKGGIKMKKIIIASILLNLVQASLLISDNVQTKMTENIILERAYLYQFPGSMPDVVIDAMTICPFYY